MREIKRKDAKLRELLLYVARRDPSVAATKLNKILYHADFRAYRELGAPITGHPYMKRELGPAPRHLTNIRESLKADGSADVVSKDIGAPHEETVIVPKRDPDVSKFSQAELAIVDDVIQRYRHYSGTAMMDETHTIPGWLAVEMNAPIRYPSALISGTVTDADKAWAEDQVAARR